MATRQPGASTLFPSGQARQENGRYWGQYTTIAGLPNGSGNVLSAVQFGKLEIGDVAIVTAGGGAYQCASVGTAGGGDAVWVSVSALNTRTLGGAGATTTADLQGSIVLTATLSLTLSDLSASMGGREHEIVLIVQGGSTVVTLLRGAGVTIDGYALDYALPKGIQTLVLRSTDGLDWRTGRALTKQRVMAALVGLTSWVDEDCVHGPVGTQTLVVPDLSTSLGVTPWTALNGNVPAPDLTINRLRAYRGNGANMFLRRNTGGATFADHISLAQDHWFSVLAFTAAPSNGALGTNPAFPGSATVGSTDRVMEVKGAGAPYDVVTTYLDTAVAPITITAAGVLALNTPIALETSRKTGGNLTLRVAGVDAAPVAAVNNILRLTSTPVLMAGGTIANFQTGPFIFTVSCNTQQSGAPLQMMRDYIAANYGIPA